MHERNGINNGMDRGLLDLLLICAGLRWPHCCCCWPSRNQLHGDQFSSFSCDTEPLGALRGIQFVPLGAPFRVGPVSRASEMFSFGCCGRASSGQFVGRVIQFDTIQSEELPPLCSQARGFSGFEEWKIRTNNNEREMKPAPRLAIPMGGGSAWQVYHLSRGPKLRRNQNHESCHTQPAPPSGSSVWDPSARRRIIGRRRPKGARGRRSSPERGSRKQPKAC